MENLTYEVELLKSLRMEMTLFWTTAFICGGGGIAFLVGAGGVQNIGLGIAGIFLMFVFAIGYFGRRKSLANIQDTLQNLKHIRRTK